MRYIRSIDPTHVWLNAHYIGIANQIIETGCGDFYMNDGIYLSWNDTCIRVNEPGIFTLWSYDNGKLPEFHR